MHQNDVSKSLLKTTNEASNLSMTIFLAKMFKIYHTIPHK